MKRIRGFFAIWSVLAAVGWSPVAPAGAKEPDSLRDDIRDALKELVDLAGQNGGRTVPDRGLDLRISRLENHLPFMDRLLVAPPCGVKAPDVPDPTAARDALRRLIPVVADAKPLETNIEEIKKVQQSIKAKTYFEDRDATHGGA